MNTVQFIQRDYIPKVDLETLNKSYNTLEQGHKEAVKAASDLEVAMANLDFNEAESEWRQQKINEIKQTVADNTIYGNSYAALDNIIMQAGNLASDQGMIGRLQAQKDYKAFKERVENDKTLPQDYKDYYLENNPYYYKDNYDKQGNIIGGTKWTPISNPTNVVPLNSLITQGIQWAAKEKGGGNMTRWIDSNGNITSDPTKAYDGEVYNTTTNSWERLTREKIWQGIRASIESTPGAKESLKQDYDVAIWKHSKNVKQNNNKPVVSDVTDDNGKILSEEQYLFKRIDPAVQAAHYNNVTTTTQYGKGLATYKAAQAKASAADNAMQMKMNQAAMSGRNTPVEVSVDVASDFLSTKNIASNTIKQLYKNLTGKDLIFTGEYKITGVEELLDKNNVPISDRIAIRNYVKAYNEAVNNLSAYTKNMSDDDKRKFDFATRMKSGGAIISSENGGSKYDDDLINKINSIYGKEGSAIKITLSDKTSKYFKDIISGGQYKGYENLGIRMEGNSIIIPKDKSDVLPMISSFITKSEDKANTGFLSTIYQITSKNEGRFSVDVIDNNGNSIYGNKPIPYTGTETSAMNTININNIRQISNIYNTGIEESNKINNKYNINPQKITVSSLNFDGKSFTEQFLLNQFNKGLISQQEFNSNKDYFNKSFENILANQDFSQTDMYYVEDGGTKKRIIDSGERFNLGGEILQAVKDGRANISPSTVAGITDPRTGLIMPGYNITILPKTNDKGKVVGDDKQKRFYIPGLINETASQMIMTDPYVQAWDAVSIAGATKTTRTLLTDESNPRLGNINITGLGNDMFSVDFNGITNNIDSKNAIKLTEAINDYNQIKNIYLSTGDEQLTDKRQRSTLAHTAAVIGEIFNINPEHVLDKLLIDINE